MVRMWCPIDVDLMAPAPAHPCSVVSDLIMCSLFSGKLAPLLLDVTIHR